MLAVGSDDTSAILTEKVMIYEYSDTNRRWLKMDAISFMSDPVHDIAFAPNIGRSYSVLAVASKELKIVTLKPNKGSQNLQNSSDKYDVGILYPYFLPAAQASRSISRDRSKNQIQKYAPRA